MPHVTLERLLDDAVESVGEPFHSIRTGCADEKNTVFEANQLGTLHPRVKGGTGHLKLDIAQGGIPRPLEIECPHKELRQQT